MAQKAFPDPWLPNLPLHHPMQAMLSKFLHCTHITSTQKRMPNRPLTGLINFSSQEVQYHLLQETSTDLSQLLPFLFSLSILYKHPLTFHPSNQWSTKLSSFISISVISSENLTVIFKSSQQIHVCFHVDFQGNQRFNGSKWPSIQFCLTFLHKILQSIKARIMPL